MNTPEDREGREARLDEALRAIAGHREPDADLRARVMAAIEASEAIRSTRRRASRVGQDVSPARGGRRGFAWPAVARPTFALAIVAVLAIGVAVWLAGRPEPAPVRVDTGIASPAVPPPDVVASPRAAAAGGEPPAAGAERSAQTDRGRRARALRRGPTRPTDLTTSIATLPPLDAPEPLAIERLDGPPLTVARLEVERLAFEPLEVEALDTLDKE